MQDPGYELPRIPIPRTPVNRSDREGQSPVKTPAQSVAQWCACIVIARPLQV
jgi:hypothetical protein